MSDVEVVEYTDLEPGMVVVGLTKPDDTHVIKTRSDDRGYDGVYGISGSKIQVPYVGRWAPPQRVNVLRGSKGDKIRKSFLKNPDLTAADLGTGPFGGFTIGTDPEIFAKAGNQVVPAYEWLGKKPSGSHPAEYYDGFQAEWRLECPEVVKYGVGTGHRCLGYMTRDRRLGLKRIHNRLQKYNLEARLVLDDMVLIDPKVLEQASSEHVALGCEPSLNAYGAPPVEIPEPRCMPWRSAGEHMHFGMGSSVIPKPSPEKLRDAVKMCDAISGVMMTSMFQGLEGQTTPVRREIYGRAGEYRLPKYGLEWRVPGPALGAHPATYNLVWDITRKAVVMGLKGQQFMWDATEEEVRKTINEYDVRLARKILTRNRPVLEAMVRVIYGPSKSLIAIAMDVIFHGISIMIDDPTDIPRNWEFGTADASFPFEPRWSHDSAEFERTRKKI
jgi:hypothetical protein